MVNVSPVGKLRSSTTEISAQATIGLKSVGFGIVAQHLLNLQFCSLARLDLQKCWRISSSSDLTKRDKLGHTLHPFGRYPLALRKESYVLSQ